MTISSGRELYEPLFRDIQAALQKRKPDLQVSLSLGDKRLQVKKPGIGWARLDASVSSDQHVSRRFYVSLIVDSSSPDRPSIIESIRRTIGPVQVLPGHFSTEIRRWSPFQAIDAARSRGSVSTWIVNEIASMGAVAWSSVGKPAATVRAAPKANGASPETPVPMPVRENAAEEADGRESIADMVRRKMAAGPSPLADLLAPPITDLGDRTTIPSRSAGFRAQGYLVYRLHATGPLTGIGKSLLLVGVSRRGTTLARADGKSISGDDKHLIYAPDDVAAGIRAGRCEWSGDQLLAQPGFAMKAKPIPWRGLPNLQPDVETGVAAPRDGTLAGNPKLEQLYEALQQREVGGVASPPTVGTHQEPPAPRRPHGEVAASAAGGVGARTIDSGPRVAELEARLAAADAWIANHAANERSLNQSIEQLRRQLRDRDVIAEAAKAAQVSSEQRLAALIDQAARLKREQDQLREIAARTTSNDTQFTAMASEMAGLRDALSAAQSESDRLRADANLNQEISRRGRFRA